MTFVFGFKSGDILQLSITINVMSDNIWSIFSRDGVLGKAKCLLNKLGFQLPAPRNGIYYAGFSDGTVLGYTVDWNGFFWYRRSATFLPTSAVSRVKVKDDYQELLITLWHELKGHNNDGAEDGPAFDAAYEMPVKNAWKSAENTSLQACCDRNPNKGEHLSNQLDASCCLCGIKLK